MFQIFTNKKNIHILLDLKFLYKPRYRMYNFKNGFQVARLRVGIRFPTYQIHTCECYTFSV